MYNLNLPKELTIKEIFLQDNLGLKIMDRVTYWAAIGAKKIKFPVLCANFWSDWIIENKYLNLKFCCKSKLETEVLH